MMCRQPTGGSRRLNSGTNQPVVVGDRPVVLSQRKLCKLVPSEGAQSISGLTNENWLTESDDKHIRATFVERFSHLPREDLDKLRVNMDHVPEGMTMVGRLSTSVQESLSRQLDALTSQIKAWKGRAAQTAKAHKAIALEALKPVLPIVKCITKKYGGVKGSDLAHDGTSIYSEPTFHGLLDIAICLIADPGLVRLFLPYATHWESKASVSNTRQTAYSWGVGIFVLCYPNSRMTRRCSTELPTCMETFWTCIAYRAASR
jgi:hypothetical protein